MRLIPDRAIPYLALLCFCLAVPVRGDDVSPDAPLQTSSPAVSNLLHTVINQQVAAFRHHDYARAYGFAATSLHQLFSQESFQMMVENHYPVIAHGMKTAFGPTLDNGSQALVFVQVMDEAGNEATYEYQLEREGKNWKIIGVVSAQPPERTA